MLGFAPVEGDNHGFCEGGAGLIIMMILISQGVSVNNIDQHYSADSSTDCPILGLNFGRIGDQSLYIHMNDMIPLYVEQRSLFEG